MIAFFGSSHTYSPVARHSPTSGGVISVKPVRSADLFDATDGDFGCVRAQVDITLPGISMDKVPTRARRPEGTGAERSSPAIERASSFPRTHPTAHRNPYRRMNTRNRGERSCLRNLSGAAPVSTHRSSALIMSCSGSLCAAAPIPKPFAPTPAPQWPMPGTINRRSNSCVPLEA
jgi:hypothetical protein